MKAMRSLAAASVILAVTLLRAGASQQATAPEPFPGLLDEHPAIAYATRPTTDRVARLNAALDAGDARLSFQGEGGYLRSVLDALGLSPGSQLLVMSKTGIQAGFTSPANPRALYFDDSLAVGYIPGARAIELAAHDPEQGVVFYTIDQTESLAPRFTRRTICVSCHVSANTLDVPGLLARSNVLGADGNILPQLGNFVVDHRTPVTQRWGGWFVTGRYDAPAYIGVAHMGNVTVAVHPTSGPATTSNEVFVQWLASTPQARGYASHESDIANLMLFDHQARAINLMTRLNWEARVAAAGGRTTIDGPLAALVGELVDYFLFVDEAPPPGHVIPPAALVNRMAAAGPRDRQGRSLRDLDFARRLLRYPCSYMIYAPAFDRLPALVKDAVYRRLGAVLSGAQPEARYAHLSAADRSAIVAILRDTKADFPSTFAR
jgi:hypothetical protein